MNPKSRFFVLSRSSCGKPNILAEGSLSDYRNSPTACVDGKGPFPKRLIFEDTPMNRKLALLEVPRSARSSR